MASTAARCIVSLGSKISPGTQIDRLRGWGTSEGRRLERVTTREMGAWLGWAGVDPPGRGGGQGFRRRPLFLFFLC